MTIARNSYGNDPDDDLNPFGEEEEDYDEGGEDTPIESE